ncbi:hypothetical protein BC477_00655 [Clavibacter michiganensis subsp. michiganensis]|uniref:Uncharacterized protein n=1 Tax=Clavibacter michiganensis subsp. michiganensis TaxID=33013 RepID=A0A251XFU5_CLAMM|nr:hypothetical protein BC477_00655 [Clavibacter michiganensis subsp. michiganensis]OUE00914.1 hypothetical protein CMMCAS07_15860 [Clavibacter michiganensis subsp. michiganensis]
MRTSEYSDFCTSGRAPFSSSRKSTNGSVRTSISGGANREKVTPSSRVISWGTPATSSGASCVAMSVTQSMPRSRANASTMVDFPIPGAPQRWTGRARATRSRTSGSWAGVMGWRARTGHPPVSRARPGPSAHGLRATVGACA